MEAIAESEHTAVTVAAGRVALSADLARPDCAAGLVIFAHGSGSSRHSPRNCHVAGALNRGGLATLLVDLLTQDEEEMDRVTAEWRFDTGLLAQRLTAATDWACGQSELEHLGVGYFGASTGAAAALAAAAERRDFVQAVVSRGGRPDLAGTALGNVLAPGLFIVGGNDPVVWQLNREAMLQLPRGTIRRLDVIPGATHLFGEPGALDCVASLALDWFRKHLGAK